MPVPANKEELLKAIETNYSKLKKELETISVEETAVKELDGHAKGTLISIDNLLAYLIGWGELVLKWNKNRSENKPVDFPETGYKWNELGKLAQKFYADYQNDDFNTLIQKLDDTVKKITSLIESKNNDELYGVGWYEKWTLGRMIQFNTASPYNNARGRIRKWKKEKKS
ncbi:TPA: ClbS/DfsB family four-helix bundle protein [Elizabethkingia anophelis]|uniref:ClbS/DfsB family four-helix bundle protein n=1 Tax=Elizabethkingia anophelis TaxID=1117645 RepID=UPI0004287B76|nr:ClbS/DfsB family four-helix bundle protein [Elizabethkingia anophelis]MCT3743816.1 ClbS/DfsB family four-helix bundle protein [Elizabethkingia anophelis]MCT4216110.1 ClbS/DfsB family four-helix bundle protein [Elizabethkingia anophelis]MDC8024745.1 ClbS/DfsB family four-helix bundle protein [Elizabethkingia anophelis]MDV3492229.1 ClbS/DfsB family four-helix bundle protein [Elizabethkingia anophelis]MDV4131198.1 ClbS/DfsB family four-helix bundle protein [Elizabethkingia anophelis]